MFLFLRTAAYYNKMPAVATSAGRYGYGRAPVVVGSGSFNQINLTAFSNWHTSNAQAIYSTNITNSYNYIFDGGAYNINDGGFDMWDLGNFISLTGFASSSNINYGTLTNTPASNYGFFVSQANEWPQIAFAYVKNGTIQWYNGGDVGTDGGGSNNNSSGTYTTTNQGRYGSYWLNQNYGTPDPTIGYLYFTIQQSNLNSAITSSNDLRKTAQPPANTYTQSFSITGSNIIFCQMLVSVRNASVSPAGFLIPSSNIVNFLSNYVQNATITIT